MNNAKKHNSPLIKELKSRIPQHTKDSTERRLSLAARIDDVLQERGLTNQEFAFMMGKKPSEISRWLSGTHNFTTETLWDIERVLNIQLLVSSPKKESDTLEEESLKVFLMKEMEKAVQRFYARKEMAL
ncbi:MAG: helix-turn-helix transcriptional regulator [Flectobacillus sp.]|jgi:transcriptional regulator with XRE-family HTH domain|nr:helix-turn-helix transcriptional regulator [Flectobacillus sp.]